MAWQAMVGPVAGLVGSIFDNRQNARNIAEQNALARRDLSFRKQEAERQFDLATADRTDAEGNRVSYTPGVGFETTLDPLVQQIVNAQQQEELRSLTDDTAKNRLARTRQDERSKEFDRMFERQSDAMDYTQPTSNPHGAVADEMMKAIFARQGSNNAVQGSAAREAVRTNSPEILTSLVNETNTAPNFITDLISARQRGTEMAKSSEQDPRAAIMQQMLAAQGGANQSPQAGIVSSNQTSGIDNERQDAIQRALYAIQSGQQSVSAGNRNVMATSGQADSSGVWNAIANTMQQGGELYQKHQDDKINEVVEGLLFAVADGSRVANARMP